MLEDTAPELAEIADAPDYADARSLIRAFRRWSDATPAHSRATQKRAAQEFGYTAACVTRSPATS
jgi:transcriptional regulator GlxA family with amidase domain